MILNKMKFKILKIFNKLWQDSFKFAITKFKFLNISSKVLKILIKVAGIKIVIAISDIY